MPRERILSDFRSFWRRIRRFFTSPWDSTTAQRRLGRRGESMAARYLKRSGFVILARNVRYSVGELDLVAADGPSVVFVEVKTRRGGSALESAGQVSRAQQVRICRAARQFLRENRLAGYTARFDIVGICWPRGQRPQIAHRQSAFVWRRASPLGAPHIPAGPHRARPAK